MLENPVHLRNLFLVAGGLLETPEFFTAKFYLCPINHLRSNPVLMAPVE